jgi:hypothetical protein
MNIIKQISRFESPNVEKKENMEKCKLLFSLDKLFFDIIASLFLTTEL